MKSFGFTSKKTDTLRNQVYQDIKLAITNGKIKPGTRLKENDLSAEMGISRGPIREAIMLLEQQGLLVTKTNRETMVTHTEENEIEYLLNPLRYTLESYALRKVFSTITDQQLQQFESILEELIEASSLNQVEEVSKKDLQFHEHMIILADEPFLLSLWHGVSNRILLHFVSGAQIHQEDHYRILVKRHRDLLESIKTRDWTQIESVLKAHIE